MVLRRRGRRAAPQRRRPVNENAPEDRLENIPQDLQQVAMPPDELERASAMAKATNQKVRAAADQRLRFEDEPAGYLAFLHKKP